MPAPTHWYPIARQILTQLRQGAPPVTDQTNVCPDCQHPTHAPDDCRHHFHGDLGQVMCPCQTGAAR